MNETELGEGLTELQQLARGDYHQSLEEVVAG
jgi:hypothetical protein